MSSAPDMPASPDVCAASVCAQRLADVALDFNAMQADDVDAVVAIESLAYPFPWGRQNFVDSLQCGYQAWIMRNGANGLIGYFLMMTAVDEAHLLNITVDVVHQRKGAGLRLLQRSTALARELGMQSMLLEVRPSNTRALEIYQRHGFSQIGLRKNYYPAGEGRREDAVVMRLPL